MRHPSPLVALSSRLFAALRLIVSAGLTEKLAQKLGRSPANTNPAASTRKSSCSMKCPRFAQRWPEDPFHLISLGRPSPPPPQEEKKTTTSSLDGSTHMGVSSFRVIIWIPWFSGWLSLRAKPKSPSKTPSHENIPRLRVSQDVVVEL